MTNASHRKINKLRRQRAALRAQRYANVWEFRGCYQSRSRASLALYLSQASEKRQEGHLKNARGYVDLARKCRHDCKNYLPA